MRSPVFTKINSAGITAMGLFEQKGKTVFVLRDYDKVEVIRHETVRHS